MKMIEKLFVLGLYGLFALIVRLITLGTIQLNKKCLETIEFNYDLQKLDGGVLNSHSKISKLIFIETYFPLIFNRKNIK